MVQERGKQRKAQFGQFDIESFYPSITKELLTKAIKFARTKTRLTEEEEDISMHARRSVLVEGDNIWIKLGEIKLRPVQVPFSHPIRHELQVT